LSNSFLKTLLSLLLTLVFLGDISLASGNPWMEMGIIQRSERAVAKDFTLPTPEGNKISLTGLRGKVILLNFWATWCGPCRTEMPAIERLYRKLKDKGFRVLAVDIMETADKVQVFMEEMNLTFPTVIDGDRKVTDLYRVHAIPTTHLIDKTGKIAGTAFGAREWDSDAAFEIIEQLLGE
jgi:peroxiredoxin